MSFETLTRFLHSLTEEIGIPGVGCKVYHRHQEIYSHCAGFADRENRIPMTTGTLLNLYSATKVLTCATALTLLEKGKFLLTDPLYEYLPEFRQMQIRTVGKNGEEILSPAQSPIHIQDLFTMSAGFSYDKNTQNIRQAIQDTDGRAPTREVIRALSKDPLSFEPGTHWQYSMCHDVLAALVEVVAGKPFGAYVKEAIFDPCGMKTSGFQYSDSIFSRMAAQYQYNYETRQAACISKANDFLLGSQYESGGAGAFSCIDDYVLFVDAMANGGVARTGERILSPCTIDLMRTNCLDEARQRDFNWGQLAGYGYGLGVRTMVDRAKGGSLGPVGEFGWGGAAGAYVMIDPDNQLAVFYGQHMRNNLEPYVHPRLRNIVYSEMARL